MEKWMNAAYDGEDEQIEIEERIEELMTSKDYDPSDTSHMAEAIAESSKDDQSIIRDYIEQRDWAKLGQKLYVMSYNYMENFATEEAQRLVSNGL
jgi:hypothetical protein